MYPYVKGSKSVRSLKDRMAHSRIIKRNNSNFRGPSRERPVINWGSRSLPWNTEDYILNPAEAVTSASNKRKFFEILSPIIPDYIPKL